jgi:rhomboid family GlyGly-CTERM serine protease
MPPSNPADESNPADGFRIAGEPPAEHRNPPEARHGPGSDAAFGRLLRSLNCDGKYGLALALTCIALVATGLGGETAQHALRYQRDLFASLEWWRLVTGHLVHLGLAHAVLNALGLVLLWMLFARDYSPRSWLVIVASAMAAIDLGLWMGDSTVLWYVGSSGALHGVLAAGVLAHLRRREPDGWMLAALLVGKLAYEQWVGALPFMRGAPVVVDAHLYGALGGLAAAIALGRAAEPV